MCGGEEEEEGKGGRSSYAMPLRYVLPYAGVPCKHFLAVVRAQDLPIFEEKYFLPFWKKLDSFQDQDSKPPFEQERM